MKLKLLWKSKEDEIFKLGILQYENDVYTFKINKDELKKAIRSGCYGIGNFDLKSMEYSENKLFDFFENRLPHQHEITNLIKSHNLDKYDKMKILELTKGKKYKDNYWLEKEE